MVKKVPNRTRPVSGDKSPPVFRGARPETQGLFAHAREHIIRAHGELIDQRDQNEKAFVPWRPIVKALREARTEPRRAAAALAKVRAMLEAQSTRPFPENLYQPVFKDGNRWPGLLPEISQLLGRPKRQRDADWKARAATLVRASLRALDLRFSTLPSFQHTGTGRPVDTFWEYATELANKAGDLSDADIALLTGRLPNKRKPLRPGQPPDRGSAVEARRRRLRRKDHEERGGPPDARPVPRMDFAKVGFPEALGREVAKKARMSWDDDLRELAELHPDAVIRRRTRTPPPSRKPGGRAR